MKKWGQQLARTEIFFYALAWLIYLVVVGTLDQAKIGLYQSQLKYFSSFYFLQFGWLPLPGGYPTMGIIFIALLAKLLFKTRWVFSQLGIIITHFGGLLLLFGGFLTAAFSYEGSMVIPEGQETNVIADYHMMELAFVDTTSSDSEDIVTAFSQGWLEKGQVLKHENLPFQVEVLQFCENCKMERWEIPKGEGYHGFSKIFDLKPAALLKQAESNRGGLIFRVTGASDEVNGIYSVIEFMPITQTIKYQNRVFQVMIRNEETHLPFTIHLDDFEKKVYPGTNMAKSYKSLVHLKDKDLNQKTIVQMNQPLRYKGYTFYQASFIEGNDEETTVLAVVKNVGYMFPYISSLIMSFGLLIHLILQTPQLIKK